ncbi:MAG: tetratricopeptide repeat protein [Chlorobiaceae bacterium]|nr:tetratricopeptide repeat protein [Chlorobiaceae bacterium]NTV61074.1 tetratricopeptide repeat protein [Chlorobiaceae bacterium]
MPALSGKPVILTILQLWLFLFLPVTACAASADTLSTNGESFRNRFVAGSFESIKGNFRAAARTYQKLLEEEPSNAALNYALSKAFAGIGEADSARIYAEKSVQLDPSNKFYIGFLAALSHQMNDFARAAVLFRQLADLDPGSTDALAMLALEYLAADDPEKALGVFQEILRTDPNNEGARAQVLLMQIQLSHYHEAIGTLSGFIAKGDGRDKLRLTLGELYSRTRQYDLAYSTLNALVLEHPEFLPAWLSVFEVSVQSSRQEVFREDLARFYGRKEISMKHKIELSNVFLVRSFKDTLYTAPAAFMISEMQRLFPNNGEVFLLAGKAEMQKKHPVEAERLLRKAVVLDPSNVDIREELVSSLMMQKNHTAARKELFRAFKRLPAMNRRLKVLEGELLYRSGELRKSALLLEKTLRWHEVLREKWLFLQAAGTLAFCYDQLGEPRRSIRLYERILEVDPGNVLMMNNLAYILALEGKELEKARELALKVTRSEPANAGFLDTLGWIYFRLGEYAKAKEILEKAAGLDPNEPEILEHLGSAYEKLGNAETAKELMDRARKLRRG